MNDPFKEFKFLTSTPIMINGKEAVIKAEVYESSKELYLMKQGGDTALLRLYSITYTGKKTSQSSRVGHL